MYKYKFKPMDLIKSTEEAGYYDPIVILGYHTFPDGSPAYRTRYILPQLCMSDGETELWVNKDGYYIASFLDNSFELLWRDSRYDYLSRLSK